MQASAEPNDCVKPNEQNRVYSNFAMASNRTFKNLFGLCRAQPKISKQQSQSKFLCKQAQRNLLIFPSAAENIKNKNLERVMPFRKMTLWVFYKTD